MDHFHVLVLVTKLMRRYYDSFEIRFTAGEFTSGWQRLEIGIGAGCTVSVTWFILIVEMIFKAVDFSKQITHVQPPKKAFVVDMMCLLTDK